MGDFIDMSGKTFGSWTVLSDWKKVYPKPGHYYFAILWECRCNKCGAIKYVRGKNLRRGKSKGCGCDLAQQYRASVTSHDMSRTRIYHIWQNMRYRCENPNNTGFENYGGRGIKVCERWQTFENFHEDMNAGYQDHLTIERIENNGDYEPKNCCWIPKGDQMKNRRPPNEWRNAPGRKTQEQRSGSS